MAMLPPHKLRRARSGGALFFIYPFRAKFEFVIKGDCLAPTISNSHIKLWRFEAVVDVVPETICIRLPNQ